MLSSSFARRARGPLIAAFGFALAAASLHAAPVYLDPKAPLEDRVRDLFAQLTPDEKLTLLEGTKFTTQPIPRLGIPPMAMADAGQGVRGGREGTHGPATAFPAGVSMGATWDPALIARIGGAIGVEVQNKGVGSQVLLGPAVNIHRTPLGGRNGEYFSEDPFLTARLAVAYIQGMQATGAVACLKHYACNNQETDRNSIDVHVSERALREIYLPAFEAGVKEGHVETVMASYNLINGEHATMNHYLLTDVLKKCWGFDGMVMSDWGGVHEVGVVDAGNDLEMPGPHDLTLPALHQALQNGDVTQAAVDEAVRRILRTIFRAGLMDGPKTPNRALVNTPEHQKLAYLAATEGIVLLKNEGALLPLDAAKIHTLAVIGPGSVDFQIGAVGSPSVTPPYIVTPLQAIQHRVGSGVTVLSAPETETGVTAPPEVFSQDAARTKPGLTVDFFPNMNLAGKPLVTRTESKIDFASRDGKEGVAGLTVPLQSARWTGWLTAPETGVYYFNISTAGGLQLFVDGKQLIFYRGEFGPRIHHIAVPMKAGEPRALRVELFRRSGEARARLDWIAPSQNTFTAAVAAAKKADAALVFVTTLGQEGEERDRPSMDLPGNQDDLIRAIEAVNPHVAVVLNNGTPVTMKRWLAQTPALVEAGLPGMEGANALAAILFGDVNPSGKLPDTLGVNREDYPDVGNYPGVGGVENYAEGIFVGYRHFDKSGITPAFPFGFGLSYTTFAYSNLKLARQEIGPGDKIEAAVDITNTGARAGEEIAELYVHDPAPKIEKAVRELKGFARVALAPGGTKTVSFTLPPRALAYCDVPGAQWKADAGTYEIAVGGSSRDLPLTAPLRLTATFTESISGLQEQLADPAHDLARGCAATASSTQKGYPPANATDGDPATRWAGDAADPQWLAIDLGAPKTIGHIQLQWETAYAKSYALEVSNDGQTWRSIFASTRGHGGLENLRFPPVTTRWVRLLGTQRGTKFGYSLYSFQVFAP